MGEKIVGRGVDSGDGGVEIDMQSETSVNANFLSLVVV